ncbi:unnamed protein product [Colias eurytheme]|nr:unnamed protein product [Colias eurytheme]
MVRNYKKKKESDVIEEDAQRAVSYVVNDGMKLRTAATIFNIKPSTLFYRVKKFKENIKPKNENYSSKHTTHQIFTNDEERMLEGYFLKMSSMNYGLTYLQGRELAYEYARALGKCPEKWLNNKLAGIEWMKSFMKRHSKLSLRKPENTSLSRSTSFNKHNVTMFFNNYEKVLQRDNYSPDRIYNLDETNIMTVVQAPNVIARTGQKQVGQSVSAERGQLITMCGIVNALGNTIPPVFIFPRAKVHESMYSAGPRGCVGFPNSPKSGWMTGPLFVKVLQHIQKITRCTKEDKILILLDNHESHYTLDAINFARENGITLLTFPPHCTHKLQPLDVAVNSSFKAKIAVAQNDWLLNHPGKTITIHDLPGIITPAYNASHTINNITSGFSAPGIYPFSRNKFTDDDFECAEVTNRTDPAQERPLIVAGENVESNQHDEVLCQVSDCMPHTANDNAAHAEHMDVDEHAIIELQAVDEPQIIAPAASTIDSDATDAEDVEMDQHNVISTTKTNDKAPVLASSPSAMKNDAIVANFEEPEKPITTSSQLAQCEKAILTPEAIRPFPKAAPRTGRKGRKKGSTRILTDTPEKCAIEAAYQERMKRKPVTFNLGKRGKSTPKNTSKKSQKYKSLRCDQSDSESDGNISLHDNSDMDASDRGSDPESDNDLVHENKSMQSLREENINESDYVLVKCHSTKSNVEKYFVAIIKRKDGNMFLVSFMKKKFCYKFFFPEKEDQSFVPITDVVKKLPKPCPTAGTSRTAALLTFNFDFSKFKMG